MHVTVVHIRGDADDPLLSPGWRQSCNEGLWLQTPETVFVGAPGRRGSGAGEEEGARG